jgi:hypothetical protein
MRTGSPQPIEDRSIGLENGIVGRLISPAPAVEHCQHDRPRLLHLFGPSSISRRPQLTTQATFKMKSWGDADHVVVRNCNATVNQRCASSSE